MKLKAGRELSQLEIIKRLNLMEIEYNPNIMGKKYYIDLYNKAIQSSQNVEKIKIFPIILLEVVESSDICILLNRIMLMCVGIFT